MQHNNNNDEVVGDDVESNIILNPKETAAPPVMTEQEEDEGADNNGDEVEDNNNNNAIISKKKISIVVEGDDTTSSPTEDEQEVVDTTTTCCCGCCTCCRCWIKYQKKWPRTYELLFEVIMPMFLLIFVSFLFGYGLSRLESPAEFERNDNILRNQYKFDILETINANVTAIMPNLCVQAFTEEKVTLDTVLSYITSTSDYILDESTNTQELPFRDVLEKMFNVWWLKEELRERATNTGLNVDIINATQLSKFVNNCTKKILPVMQKLFLVTAELSKQAVSETITLNWSRCPLTNGTSNSTDNSTAQESGQVNEILSLLRWDSEFIASVDPDKQAAQYREVFNKQLHDSATYQIQQYMIANNIQNRSQMNDPEHFPFFRNAYVEAGENATGRTGCYNNIPASVWFWFTVMTTIGYGNTSTNSVGGRAMIYTLGFLSMLLFGAITARAGTIVSEMFDEACLRIKWLKSNAVALITRMAFYYLWILVIAQHYQRWQQQRLGDADFGLNDGYWFGYISTTTVGLGDYYLDPAVITYGDLFAYPLLFLFGFFLLAAFLGKLAEFLGVLTRHTTRKAAELTKSAAQKASRFKKKSTSTEAGGTSNNKKAETSTASNTVELTKTAADPLGGLSGS